MNGRIPPQARDIEQAVLGAILIERDAVEVAAGLLSPSDFYDSRNQYIYEAILSLSKDNEPIDMLTVKNRLQKMGKIEDAGGSIYLVELTNKVATGAHVKSHSLIVLQKSKERQLITLCSETIDNCYKGEADFSDTLNYLTTGCIQLDRGADNDTISIDEAINEVVDRIHLVKEGNKEALGLSTGLNNLDNVITALEAGKVYLAAARPAMGKSALIQNIATNVAKTGKAVGVVSLEMTAPQITARMLSAESGIPQQAIKSADIHSWDKFNKGAADLYELPIYFNTSISTAMQLRSWVNKMVKEKGIELLVVDYLQLMSGDKNGQNREREISEISRALKKIALDYSIPVLPLSQLSRAVETRGGDKRPILSDLRESGAIEQDADVVIFLYRPSYYGITQDADGNEYPNGLTELIIAKNRDGETKTVYTMFEGGYSRFTDYEGDVATAEPFYEPNNQTPF